MFACNRNYQENNNIKKDQENNDLKKEGLRGNVSSIRQLKYQVIGKNIDSLLIKKGKFLEFDSTGTITYSESHKSDPSIFKYTTYEFQENGIQCKEFNSLDSSLTGIQEITFDKFGNKTKCKLFSPSREHIMTFKYEFDKYNKMNWIIEDPHNQQVECFRYGYNKRGERIEQRQLTEKGELKYLWNYEFNLHSDCIKESKYNPSKKIISTIEYTYIYDEHNNWISKIQYTDGLQTLHSKREITYR